MAVTLAMFGGATWDQTVSPFADSASSLGDRQPAANASFVQPMRTYQVPNIFGWASPLPVYSGVVYRRAEQDSDVPQGGAVDTEAIAASEAAAQAARQGYC